MTDFARGVDAHGLGGVFVLADRDEVRPEAPAHHVVRREHPAHREQRDEVEERLLALPVDGAAEERDLGQRGDEQAHGAVRQRLPVERDEPRDLGDGEGGEREVRAAQAKAQVADRQREDRRDQAAERNAVPRRELELEVQDHRRVRADAEERGVSERHLTRVAAEQVPREPEQRPHQHRDREVQQKLVVGEPRQCEQEDDRDRRGDPVHARPTPKRPCGRNRSTSRKMTNPIVSLYATEM